MVRFALVALLVPLLCCSTGCRRRTFRTPPTSPEPRAFEVSFNPNDDSTFALDTSLATTPGPGSPPPGIISDFFTLFNNQRVQKGAPGGAIPWDPVLAGVAQAHLDEMLSQGYFSLVSPSGVTMPARAVASGSVFFTTTQGIAKGYSSGLDLFWAIMDSGNDDFENAINNYFAVQPTGIGIAFDSRRGGSWAFIIRD